MWIETAIHKHLLMLSVSGKPLLTLPYHLEVDGVSRVAESVQADGLQAQARWRDCTITDVIERKGPLLTIRRRWNLLGQLRVRLWFEVLRRMAPVNWIVPGLFHRVEGESRPGMLPDPFWGHTVPEDAATVPSCVALEDRQSCFAVFTSPAESVEELTSAVARLTGDFVSVALDVPGLPTGAAAWDVDGHLTYERSFYVYVGERPAIPCRPVMDAAWEHFAPEAVAPAVDWGAGAAERAAFLLRHFFIERSDAVGFVPRLSRWHTPRPARLEGETNLEAALALYRVGVETDSKSVRRMALDAADFFIGGAEGRAALVYRLGRRRWAPAADAEGNLLQQYGAAAYYAARLIQAAAAKDDASERWLLFLKRICGALAQNQWEDGAIGLPWWEGGRPADLHALYGLWALVEAGTYLREAAYIETAERAAAKYAGALERGAFPDVSGEETRVSRDLAGAALRAFRMLHQLTGKSEYREWAERAGHFLAMWVYAYDVPFPERTDAGRRRLCAVGAARVDTGVSGFDFAGLRWAVDLLHLGRMTGDSRWRRVADAQLRFAAQGWGEKARAARGFFEEDFQPDFVRTTSPSAARARRGAVEGISLATTARTLLALLDIREAFPDAVRFSIPSFSLERTPPQMLGHALVQVISFLNPF